jgi:hypothetical protein
LVERELFFAKSDAGSAGKTAFRQKKAELSRSIFTFLGRGECRRIVKNQ